MLKLLFETFAKKFQIRIMKLFLVDGHALIFKMYYAFLRRPMINSKGVDTSILFGFTKYILELIEREKPTHLAVAFDPPGGTFRNEMYPAYKANRAETPQLVIDALEPLTELCQAMNIPVLMIKGFEADDVIGSMAKKSAAEGFDVYMVTPDKDYGQLVEDHIWQYKSGKSGGENEILGVQQILDRYGISRTYQVIDMLALCGDTADNVPGVNGVGEVSAAKLIGKYGTLENIYNHIDELSDRQKAQFEAASDYIALSKELVTIKTDIALDVSAEDMKLDLSFSPSIADLFEKYEFNSLKRHINHVAGMSAHPEAPASEQIEVREESPRQMVLDVCMTGSCAIECKVEGHGIFARVKAVMMVCVIHDEYAVCEGSVSDFKRVLEDPTITKYGYDLKYQMNVLAESGVSLGGKMMDVELMHYLLDPEKSHNLDILARHYLGISLGNSAEEEMASLFDQEETLQDVSRENGFRRLATILSVGLKVLAEMHGRGLSSLYDKMEEKLLKVLSGMERTGVKVDVDSLKDFADMLRSEIVSHENFVRELAGDPSLNLSSPKQVGELVFEKFKLDPKAKKSGKGGWSTDEATLLELSDRSPVIDEILQYRAAKKLLSTYIEPFPGYISPKTGRVHTTFNQSLTSTGRLSSSNPNLQNIPIRTERGKEIRKAFVACDPQWWIMSADYSQIELRIMAHLSADSHLVQAFKKGQDVHSATAAKIFGIPIQEVNSDQRRQAKTANFGIMYGISAFGLAQRLGIQRSEAKKLIDDYFASFPSIASFIENTLASAREKGYVETLFGRRRYVPDVNSHNATIRALAERNAVNAPIQGTAADIIKMAMVAVDKAVRDKHLRSRMVLQVHDELVFEVPEEELDTMKKLVTSAMENVIRLSIPLTVECNYGKNWLEAH